MIPLPDWINIAVTLCAWLIVTMHVPLVAVHAPLQPAKREPLLGVALNVTTVPALKLAEQVEGHIMLSGGLVLTTVPVPAPLSVTVSVKVCVPFIVVVTEAELLIRFGSGCAPATFAVAVIEPEVIVGVIVKVAGTLWPLGIFPNAQVMVVTDPLLLELQFVGDSPTGNAFGIEAVNVTPVAFSGPLLTTVTL